MYRVLEIGVIRRGQWLNVSVSGPGSCSFFSCFLSIFRPPILCSRWIIDLITNRSLTFDFTFFFPLTPKSRSITFIFADLRQKFRDLSKQYSPEPRPFYVHLTSVIVRRSVFMSCIRAYFFFLRLLSYSRIQKQLLSPLELVCFLH